VRKHPAYRSYAASRTTSIKQENFHMNRSFRLCTALLLATTALVAPAMARDTYIGGAVGQSRITASDPALGPNDFREHDTGFKLMAGMKGPLPIELEYIDFGSTDGNLGSSTVNGKLNALAAFTVIPLPAPLPGFDVYGKAGLARLDTRVIGSALDFSSRNTEFAWGLGAKFKVGKFFVRAEYERFRRKNDADPALLSLGFVKYFGHKRDSEDWD
jgi:opacity protein-like surface antigen